MRATRYRLLRPVEQLPAVIAFLELHAADILIESSRAFAHDPASNLRSEPNGLQTLACHPLGNVSESKVDDVAIAQRRKATGGNRDRLPVVSMHGQLPGQCIRTFRSLVLGIDGDRPPGPQLGGPKRNGLLVDLKLRPMREIGRASCRERV